MIYTLTYFHKSVIGQMIVGCANHSANASLATWQNSKSEMETLNMWGVNRVLEVLSKYW